MTLSVLIVTALALLTALYVIAPLRRDQGELLDEPLELIGARERKARALTALLDVEEEAQVGKLEPAEEQQLRRGYEREAIAALEDLDRLSAGADGDDRLEAEIAEMRGRLACPSCGAPRASGETCSRCGA